MIIVNASTIFRSTRTSRQYMQLGRKSLYSLRKRFRMRMCGLVACIAASVMSPGAQVPPRVQPERTAVPPFPSANSA